MDPTEKPVVQTQSSSTTREVQRTNSSLSKKESMRRDRRPGLKAEQRLDISDLYKPDVTHDEENIIVTKSHILESANCDQVLLARFVMNELKDLGVMVDSSSFRRTVSKGRKPTNLALPPNQFLEIVEAKIDNTVIRLNVPHIVKLTCEFIRKDISTEGIFRKSGLASRIKSLKKRFDRESGVFEPDDTVFDASSVLKQYLRELPCPLIPYDIQPVFLKCLEKSDEKTIVESILLSVYLLPLPNIHIISYLMGFLHEITKYSHLNRMGHKNLALVMTPNIMPVEIKKSTQKGKDIITMEKLAHENHRKVVEILILYGDYVGWVSKRLRNALNIHESMCRNSEDELEVEVSKDGRRKKRRSGSLTRMLGFLRKVTNSRGNETPGSAFDSADDDVGLHTPVIKGISKKRNNEEPLFSSTKKKTILDAVRRHGLYGDDPNSIHSPGLITCPSPAICLDPSPLMRTDWKHTPKLITPSLLRDKKRSKSARETERVPLAAPTPTPLKTSTKNKVGFGRKSGKKAALIQQQVQERLQKSGLTVSAVSIHHLTDSPRKHPPVHARNSGQLLTIQQQQSGELDVNTAEINHVTSVNSGKMDNGADGDGIYVTISNSATTDDPKNDAFITSSNTLNLTDDDDNPCNGNMNEKGVVEHNENKFDNTTPEILRLTPLIKEINTLTMFAQQDVSMMTVDERKDRNDFESTFNSISPPLPPRSRSRPSRDSSSTCLDDGGTPSRYLDNSPAIAKVAEEFQRTVKEERIIHLASEMKTKKQQQQQQKPERLKQSPKVQRCASLLQSTKGVSPSQRKINSFRRRRSHDPATSKSTFGQSPRFMSLRSPRSRPTPPPPLVRSPTRCTLRRGRPNTTWAGLAKPSPCRSTPNNNSKLNSSKDSPRKVTSTSTTNGIKTVTTTTVQSPRRQGIGGLATSSSMVAGSSSTTPRLRPRNEMGTVSTITTPCMRRMSSVQELVQKLESKAKYKTQVMPKHHSAVEFGQRQNKIPPPPRGPSESIQGLPPKSHRPTTLALNNVVEKDRRSLPSNSGQWEVRESLLSLVSKSKMMLPVDDSTKNQVGTAEKIKMPAPALPTPRTTGIKTTPNQGSGWTSASDFFESNPMMTRSSTATRTPTTTPVTMGIGMGDRESIHVLKTRNAGKVSANVKMFDRMVNNSPSNATKSLIPRYTALHASKTSQSQLQRQ